MYQRDNTDPVIVLGTYRQTLTVIRSLARAGHRVFVPDGSRYLQHSRYVHGVLPLPPVGDPALLAELALRFPASGGRVFVYPIGDHEIDFILRHEAELPAHFTPVLANREAIRICASKRLLYDSAAQAGVPCERSVVVGDPQQLRTAAESVGFPCLIKADSDGRIDRSKAVICETPEQLADFTTGRNIAGRSLIVQPYFRGRRFNVYFFAEHGSVLADAYVKILRTNTPDETGLAVEGISVERHPLLRTYTERLVDVLHYHGAGCAQYLVDEERDGIMFLEINARLGANFATVYRGGLDLPRLAVAQSAGLDVRRLLPGRVATGRRYAWLYGDLMGLIRARRELSSTALVRRVGQMLRTQFLADDHIIWDWRDPMPSLWVWFDRLAPWRPNPPM